MAARFTQEKLDRMVEAARASDHPYRVLEGGKFKLSASAARAIVVAHGLSKSKPEVREAAQKTIARWLEAGAISGKAKAAPKPEPKADESDAVIKVDEPQAVEVPEAAAAGVDAAYAEAEKHRRAPRKRAPRQTGEASDTARAIAANRITAPSA